MNKEALIQTVQKCIALFITHHDTDVLQCISN